MNIKTRGIVFQVFVAALASPDEQLCPSPLRNMLSSTVSDAMVYFFCTSLISAFLTDTRPAWPIGLVVTEEFHLDEVARSGQVMYTSSIVTASCVTESGTKKLFRHPARDSVTAPLQPFAQLTNRNTHCIGWTAQPITHAWNKSAFSVGISMMKKLVRSFTVLKTS